MGDLVNVRIASTQLGPEDHGIFTAFIFIEGKGFGGGFGGYALGLGAADWVQGVLKCANVDRWERLPGKYLRVPEIALGCQTKRVYHVIDDAIYFDADEWAAKTKAAYGDYTCVRGRDRYVPPGGKRR